MAPPKSPVPRALRGGAGAYFTKRATIKVEAGLVVILLRSCRLSSSLYALGRRPVHPVLPGPCPCPARRVQRSLGQTLSRSQIADFEVREEPRLPCLTPPLGPLIRARVSRVHREAKNQTNMVIDKNTHNVSRLAAATHGHGTVSSTSAWSQPGLSSWHGGYAASDSPCAWGGGLRRRQRKEARRSPCV